MHVTGHTTLAMHRTGHTIWSMNKCSLTSSSPRPTQVGDHRVDEAPPGVPNNVFYCYVRIQQPFYISTVIGKKKSIDQQN